MVDTPMDRNRKNVLFPIIGIFLIDSGKMNGFTFSPGISSSPLGLASPAAILETVLFTDNPNETGSPVLFIISLRSSFVHARHPKKRSIPVISI